MKCPCFYFEGENGPNDPECACGHTFDEHDESLECQAEVDDEE